MGNKLNEDGLKIVWNKVWSLIKSITGDVNVTEKGTLQEQIDDCFQSVSDGKALVASAITDKGVTTSSDATFAIMAANIENIETELSLQSKSVSLSTSEQTIKPDSGYDGLSQVSVPAITGTAEVSDVVTGKTFNSATAGIGKTGTLADKTGTANYSGTASLDTDNNRLKMQIPAQGKYGTGNYLYAAYSTVASLIGLTAAKLASGNTILGISGNSNVVDTSAGTATAAQILSGKIAYVDGLKITGSMTNRQGTTVDASAVSQDDTYTYFTTPAGSYSATSKVRTLNSNLNYKTIYGGGVYETPLLGSVSFAKGSSATFSVTFTYKGSDKADLTADNFTACYGTLNCTGSDWNAIDKGYISGKSYDATTGVLTITCYLHTSSSVQGTHGATGTVNIFRLK